MRSKNPEYMEEIIAYVDRFYSQTHEYPTCSQIAENTSLQRAFKRYMLAGGTHGNGTGVIVFDGEKLLSATE